MTRFTRNISNYFRLLSQAATGRWCVVVILALLLLSPLLALFLHSFGVEQLSVLNQESVYESLELSLRSSVIATLISTLIGTPLAWLLLGLPKKPMLIIETFLQLPIVIPPAVAGVALLMTFGKQGLLHHVFLTFGIDVPSLAFSQSALVIAEIFVAAPYFVQVAVQSFRSIDKSYIDAAASLGISSFNRFRLIVLPLAWRGLLAGATLCWARALGEFGATLMFAGNLPGVGRSLPLLIYTAMEDDTNLAMVLSLFLIIVALVVLLISKIFLIPASFSFPKSKHSKGAVNASL